MSRACPWRGFKGFCSSFHVSSSRSLAPWNRNKASCSRVATMRGWRQERKDWNEHEVGRWMSEDRSEPIKKMIIWRVVVKEICEETSDPWMLAMTPGRRESWSNARPKTAKSNDQTTSNVCPPTPASSPFAWPVQLLFYPSEVRYHLHSSCSLIWQKLWMRLEVHRHDSIGMFHFL